MSTYDNEDSCEKIDYFRHIRNAVAHSKCNYFSDRGKNFVIFSGFLKISFEFLKNSDSTLYAFLSILFLQILVEIMRSDLHSGTALVKIQAASDRIRAIQRIYSGLQSRL